ncbi:MAG: GNAT family N-acetyltransferase, partial [Acidobacteriota bacterium]
MAIEVSVVRELTALRAIESEWRELAAQGPGALFRGPDWLIPWWLAYHNTLHAELHVLIGRATEADPAAKVGDLVCIAPLYRRSVKVALLDTRELRMMGDAGPRPPSLDLLARAGWEDRAGAALARGLVDLAATWDVIDLEPLADPSRVRANLVQRIAPAGFAVESSPSAGGASRIALALAPADSTDATGVQATTGGDLAALRKGMSVLRRLSRLEWAERDEPSPLADEEAANLLEDVALELGKAGRVRLARLDDATGEACAAALVVDDGDRAVVLAMAVDPQTKNPRAAQRLLHAEALAARARGCVALDVVTGAVEYGLPMLPVSKQPALAVRIWGHSTTASVGRTYARVARRARSARETPSVAAAQARAAWTRIRHAAATVAQYDRYALYRGQLWTRGIEPPPGLELASFTEADYDKLDEARRADLVEQLALDELTARKYWRRGDHAVLARLGIRPAGIVWTARGP